MRLAESYFVWKTDGERVQMVQRMAAAPCGRSIYAAYSRLTSLTAD